MGCCETLSGFTRNCEPNIGGIRRAWIACHDEIKGDIEIVKDEISKLASPAAFHEFEFRKQTGSVTTTITRDDAAGTLYYESSIVLQFSKQETRKRIEINAIALDDMVVVIEDNNLNCWYFGYDFPVTLSDGSAETGTAFADMNGYTITLNDLSKELPYQLTKTAIDELIEKTAG